MKAAQVKKKTQKIRTPSKSTWICSWIGQDLAKTAELPCSHPASFPETAHLQQTETLNCNISAPNEGNKVSSGLYLWCELYTCSSCSATALPSPQHQLQTERAEGMHPLATTAEPACTPGQHPEVPQPLSPCTLHHSWIDPSGLQEIWINLQPCLC